MRANALDQAKLLGVLHEDWSSSSNYEKLDEPPCNSSKDEHGWDQFLRNIPLGHFQQSTGWADVKRSQGWGVTRYYSGMELPFRGGWQLLWKGTRLGRMGFINKGPVLDRESPEAISIAMLGIVRHAKQLGLRALVLQPPDMSKITHSDLIRNGFSDLRIGSVIDATLLADVSGSQVELEKRISRRAKQEEKKAIANGVTVSSAGPDQLPVFFELMRESALRAGETPNPATVDSLQAIWDAFHPKVDLALAKVAGRLTAGLLTIGFGQRLSFWKKGWNGGDRNLHANTMLNVACLRKANLEGYREVDFVGCDREFALSVIADQALTPSQRASRDVFNLRLGAAPQILPPAQILIINRGMRRIFNTALCLPWLRRMAATI